MECYTNINQWGEGLSNFRMIKYHKQSYPPSIPLCIEEVAGHFDVEALRTTMAYSLHTEYSYGKRSFSSERVKDLNAICSAQRNGVPQLWTSIKWAEEFAEFLERAIQKLPQPKVIEIHPPFDDYTEDVEEFVQRYKAFESIILTKLPNTEIHIENRCGSIYSRGKFVISTLPHLIKLCDTIERDGLALRIALDIPQLYTAHNAFRNGGVAITGLLDEVRQMRRFIAGVHLWGKGVSSAGRKVAHYGDLNAYFSDQSLKQEFLVAFHRLFDDGKCRNLVLEVNSGNEDLISIISDLESAGIRFCC